MQIRLTQEHDEKVWNELVYSSRGSFLQTWEWGEFQQSLGRKTWPLVAETDGHIQAVALVIRHELPLGLSWLYIPAFVKTSAGVAAWQLLENELVKLAREEKAIFVRADFGIKVKIPPHLPLSGERFALWRKAPREVQPKDTLVLDLTKSEEELLTGMHSKTRYNIRLAQKHGVTVRFSTDVKDVEIFLALAKSVAGRSGFSYHPDEYYRKLIEVLGNKQLASHPGGIPSTGHPPGSNAGHRGVMAELAMAGHEGQVLAAHIMIYAGGTATYVHGASSNEKRELMAPQLLYWETIRRAKQKGCKTFDFYGVSPEGAGQDHPWSGVTRMKMGFGGERKSYAGAYDMVLKPVWYWGMNFLRSLKLKRFS